VPAQYAAGLAFDLIASKLRPPSVRSDAILRPWLIERLTRDDSRPVVSVVAPPGYGKTTLLAQWAEHSSQAFAWVSVGEEDNDPRVLLSYVAHALDAVQSVSGRVFGALASPSSSVPGSVVPRLASAFWSMAAPVVLVLDDVHLLHNRECRDALSVLADHVPPGSRLVLAGRNEPPLRVARLRAEGRILEIGPGDLSLLAMARGDWGQAEALAGQAGTVLRRAGMENLLACAVQARAALHRGDVPAARQQLVSAQRLRPMVTYAMPHLAVQARIELARVHLALADVAEARTLMQEIDELLKRRPDLGTLVGQAQVLRTQLSAEHGPGVPRASSLTGAELRVLPMLATHLSFPEIGADLFLSPNTVKSQAISIYRKLGASSRSQAVARSRELGLLGG
jgi:ATP/maltotriose-dependent transcriptional regulator MalT